MRVLKGVLAVIAISIIFSPTLQAAKHYKETLMVNVKSLQLRLAPKMRAGKVPGVNLPKYTRVDEIDRKGRKWVKIKRGQAAGWVRAMAVIMSDPSKARTPENIRLRGLERIGQGTDQSGYGSAAAARGISSLGKVMNKEKVFNQNDMKAADIVTEYRITGVTGNRAQRAKIIERKVDQFLREGRLGDYLP